MQELFANQMVCNFLGLVYTNNLRISSSIYTAVAESLRYGYPFLRSRLVTDHFIFAFYFLFFFGICIDSYQIILSFQVEQSTLLSENM